MEKKRALITGITGQVGIYLAKFLLEKGYEVYGMYRRSVLSISERTPELDTRVNLVEGDLRDAASLIFIIKKYQPNEIYNLAAQSFLATSWEEPELSCDVNGMGVLRLLEAIRIVNPTIKLYQASSREIFGFLEKSPQNESTYISPINLYASAKAFGQAIISSYRQKYGMYISSGIAYNHESPLRGREFVTRIVSNSVSRIKLGQQEFFKIGNLNAKRDWGFAGDYVEAMWLSLQQDKPGDYILATGETHSVRELIEEAFMVVDMPIMWEGEGLNEVGKHKGVVVVKIDEKFYRSEEEEFLLGDISKAKKVLGWTPKTNFRGLVRMMVESDLKKVVREVLLSKI